MCERLCPQSSLIQIILNDFLYFQSESKKTAAAKPGRYYLNIVMLSALCLAWFIIDHTLVPRRQSSIAPSRLTHGFGVRLPGIGFKEHDAEGCMVHRNHTHFRLEYGLSETDDFNSTQCFKEILIYGSINNMLEYPEMAPILNLFKQDGGYTNGYSDTTHLVCPNVKCATVGLRVGTDSSYFTGKDAIVFGMFPKAFGGRLDFLSAIKPSPGQIWIYYSQEPPLRVLQWVQDPKLENLRYHKSMTYTMDSDIQRPFGYYINSTPTTTSSDVINLKPNQTKTQNKTKLIAWMASNCEEVFWPRYDYIQQLMVHVHIDTYGRCGQFNCLPRDAEQCYWKLNQYKFYLALTNSECRHYITEKFWHTSLQYNIVPIVYGAPKVDFERFAPPNSYIHVSDFDSPKELAEYLQVVDRNDTLYNSYFDWKRTGHVESNFPPHADLFCDIVANLENDSPRSVQDKGSNGGHKTMPLKLLRNSQWWGSCRHEVNMTSAINTRYQKLRSGYNSWKPWKVDK